MSNLTWITEKELEIFGSPTTLEFYMPWRETVFSVYPPPPPTIISDDMCLTLKLKPHLTFFSEVSRFDITI